MLDTSLKSQIKQFLLTKLKKINQVLVQVFEKNYKVINNFFSAHRIDVYNLSVHAGSPKTKKVNVFKATEAVIFNSFE